MSEISTFSDLVAANVRAEMAAQRLTVAELAQRLGIGRRAAERRCAGLVPFSLNELTVVAEWLGVRRVDLAADRVRTEAAAS